MNPVFGTIAVLAGVVAASYVLEAFRRAPRTPAILPWAPEIPIRYATVDRIRLRYIEAGSGPTLVLLHTMRTQLDLFQRVIATLARRYRVYALDLPGHGYSDVPPAEYTAPWFIGLVGSFLEERNIEDAVVVGESIGGTIALGLAARGNPRVRAVVAINPYDYDGGRGLRRVSPIAWLIFGVNDVPVLGGTVARLRQYPIVKHILDGGLHRERGLPRALARELYRVGDRPGHGRALASLVHHWPSWEHERDRYPDIRVPVLLLYGEHDWSRPDERAETARRIPGAERGTVESGGHFLSFDAPEDVISRVVEFVDRLPARLPS